MRNRSNASVAAFTAVLSGAVLAATGAAHAAGPGHPNAPVHPQSNLRSAVEALGYLVQDLPVSADLTGRVGGLPIG